MPSSISKIRLDSTLPSQQIPIPLAWSRYTLRSADLEQTATSATLPLKNDNSTRLQIISLRYPQPSYSSYLFNLYKKNRRLKGIYRAASPHISKIITSPSPIYPIAVIVHIPSLLTPSLKPTIRPLSHSLKQLVNLPFKPSFPWFSHPPVVLLPMTYLTASPFRQAYKYLPYDFIGMCIPQGIEYSIRTKIHP